MFIHVYNEHWNQGHYVAAFRAGVDTLAEIKQWCYATYGNPGHRWIDNVHFGEALFNNQQDLEWFLLRWS